MRILVIGGTGRVGSAVVSRLAGRGEQVSVLTRSVEKLVLLPKGVDGRLGDTSQPQILPGVMEGTKQLVLITAQSEHETEEGIAVVEAAKKTGVSQIAFLSVFKPENGQHVPSFKSKIEIQKAIEASGIEFTVIKPNNFYQNDYLFEQPIMDYGVYPLPLGDVGLNCVDIRDIADAFVTVLTEPGHAGKSYPLVGPDVWTGKKIAEVYSRNLGRPVRYGGDNLNAWGEQARLMMPAWLVRDLKIMFEFVQLNGLIASKEDFEKQERVLKHPPRTYEDFVKETIAMWQKGTHDRQ